MRDWIRRRLAAAGYVVFNTRSSAQYAQDSLFTANSDAFRRDPGFRAAYARGLRASHGVDPRHEWRVHVALWAAELAARVPGDFVECGVNSGFMSSAIMERLDWGRVEKTFYLIDTFTGPVAEQFSGEEVRAGRLRVVEEVMESGGYEFDLGRIEENFAEWPNARVVQGVVPEVLARLEIGRVAFLHLDMNCAFPEVSALEFFWERLAVGGVVLLDDYAYYGMGELRGAIVGGAGRLGASVLAFPTGQGLIVR